MNGYLVPANAKKGTLIFNLFRPFDLILFGTGVGISLILLLSTSGLNSALMTILSCIPVGVTGLLVLPIPNYHNVLCALQSIIRFFTERRKYYWKGWCFYERFAEEYKRRK